MSKALKPRPVIVELGGMQVTLRVEYPLTKDLGVFPVLMVQCGTTLHAFVRSGPPAWVNMTDDARRTYINQLLGPEYVSRVLIHPDMELRLEMDNEHFILRNGELVEVFSLKTSRLVEYLKNYDVQVQEAQPVVRQLIQLEHVFDDIVSRQDVWNSKDLAECLDAHPTVDAIHRLKVGTNSLHYHFTLRNEGVTLVVNFTTDTKLFNIGRGELRVDGCGYYYTINAVDGLRLDCYRLPGKAAIEQQAETFIRKLVEFIMENSAYTVETV